MRISPTPTDPGIVAGTPRKPRDDEVEAFGLTHQGKVRPDNQDHFLLCSLHKTMRVHATSLPAPELLEVPSERLAFIGMVADGVGGAPAGEAASRAALETIALYITHTMRCYYTNDPTEEAVFLEALRAAAKEGHEALLAGARQDPGLEGMATTLTLGIGVWPVCYVLHVGDSRFYRLLRDGRLEQLTRDQTMAQDLVDSGLLPPQQARQTPLANILSSSIGGTSRPEVSSFDLSVSGAVLLCTDGLTKHVPDERIRERLLGMTSCEQACRALVDDALDAGGTDNVTVVAVRAVRRE